MNRYFFLALLLLSFSCFSQDSLPNFSVVHKGNNRIIVSWNNKYPQLKQISIQRSSDSLNNFKTILTVPDPMNPQNGFMDTKAQAGKLFYRIYILFNGGNFLVSKPKTPIFDSILLRAITPKLVAKPIIDFLPEPELDEVIQHVKKMKDVKFNLLTDTAFRNMDGSITIKNKLDLQLTTYRIIANSEGLVKIRLSDFNTKKYSIKFYEEDATFLFEIKSIKEPLLLLEKSNFLHAGWFYYELFENEKLTEKQRFFIPKSF